MSITAHESRESYTRDVLVAQEAAAAYYNTDLVVMDDPTFDALMRRIAATESEHPEWVSGDAVSEVVAAGAAGGDVPHSTPMLSLDNVFSADELGDWLTGLKRRLGRPVTRYTVEPKMDGMAMVARYVNGKLTDLVTRGDGQAGESLAHAIGTVVGLPTELNEPVTVEVRGEVVLTDQQLLVANDLRVANGKPAFVNPRNGVAGALRAKDRAYVIPSTFFAYGVGAGYLSDVRHSDAMERVAQLGVQTTAASAAGLRVLSSPADIQARVAELGDMKSGGTIGFDIDGAVIKADDNDDRNDAGFSSKAPHWAIAYKYPPDWAISTLEEVIWQIGRTGVVTPRARIAPVFVGGTTVTYSTLHNPGDLNRKGFLLYDKVSVHRAGEVIPRLEAPVVDLRTGNEVTIEVPLVCPRCESDLDKSQARWRCVRGRVCGLEESIDYAASRDSLDIKGLGAALAKQLVAAGLVDDVADLFYLNAGQLAVLEGMGPASAEKVIAEIEGAKTQPLSRVFCALGVRGTGRSMSRRIARHFGTMDAIRSATLDELELVDGIGKEKAPVIIEELATLASAIDKLIDAGVNMTEPGVLDADAADMPFAGKIVCVSGSVPGLSRTEAQEAVERLGGKSSSSISKKTSLLVAGDGAGSKLGKAEALGVEVMSASDFAALVR